MRVSRSRSALSPIPMSSNDEHVVLVRCWLAAHIIATLLSLIFPSLLRLHAPAPSFRPSRAFPSTLPMLLTLSVAVFSATLLQKRRRCLLEMRCVRRL